MIETKESLEKLDEIMSTPGVDGIYIGPADLSLALGENLVLINQKILKLIQKFLEFQSMQKKIKFLQVYIMERQSTQKR